MKHIDNSRLVREVDVERRREWFGLLGMGTLVFLFGLLVACQHFKCVRHGYQIEQLKAEYAALEDQNHQLRLEEAALADPQRIDTLARTQLGMVTPGPQQVIRVAPEPARGTLSTVPNGHATSPWVAEIFHTSHSDDGPTEA